MTSTLRWLMCENPGEGQLYPIQLLASSHPLMWRLCREILLAIIQLMTVITKPTNQRTEGYAKRIHDSLVSFASSLGSCLSVLDGQCHGRHQTSNCFSLQLLDLTFGQNFCERLEFLACVVHFSRQTSHPGIPLCRLIMARCSCQMVIIVWSQNEVWT